MKMNKVALISVIGAAVVIAGIAVVGLTVFNDKQSGRSQLDKSMAASVRNQIEKPLELTKGEVKNLVKTSDDASHIAIKWDAVPNALGYNIYLCDKDTSNTFSKIDEVTETSYDIPNLQENACYWIKVAAFIKQGFGTSECPATLLKTVTHVTDVTGLEMEHSGEVLGFSWKENPRYDGYEIYRAHEGTSNQFELYDTIDNTKAAYDDEDVEFGTLYTYKVCPFRKLGNDIYRAEGKTIELLSGLSAPAGLVGRTANKRIVLYWQDRSLATGYDVYMSKEDEEMQKVDSTDSTVYTSEKLEAGTTYNFRIVPYREMDDKTMYGTWSSCSLKASKEGEGTADNPRSTIVGSGTYIEISIKQQHMWFYEDGKLVLDTEVVTGNDDGEHNTHPGSFCIEDRGTDVTLVGEDYETPVTFWMGFDGGIGIHDANWRGDFGGDIYQGDGSHGCVNTPYDKAEIIYNHTDYNTPVYVY